MVKKTFLSLLVMSLTVAIACSKSKGNNGLLFLLMGGGKPLEVTSVAPVEGGTGIATDATIRIQFSEEVDQTTATTAITLKDPGDASINGSFSFSGDAITGTLVTFTPDSALLNLTTYTVTVATSVKGLKGSALASIKTWSFTTVSLGTVPNPEFDPMASTYLSAQSVTINCSEIGATIWYTDDNSDPSDSSTRKQYTGTAIPVAVNTILKAYARKDYMDDSGVETAEYLIRAAMPTFDPVEGSYGYDLNVDLLAPGALIYYNVNSVDDPTELSTLYDGSLIPVEGNGTTAIIKAIAVEDGKAPSPVATATFTVDYSKNSPPVADAGGLQEILTSTATVNLSGAASSDPDQPYDSITAYNWDTDGDGLYGADDTGGSTFCTGCTTSDATGENIIVNNPGWTAGTVKLVSLKVTDAYGHTSAAASASILVGPYPEVKTRNILLAPPYGSGNLNYLLNRSLRIKLPKLSGDEITRWRIDFGGDGTWDTDWSADSLINIVIGVGGWSTFVVQAMSDTNTCVYAMNGDPSNGIFVPSGGEGYFSEILAGSLAAVQDSSVVLGDLDGDGDLDLILTGTDSTLNKTAKVYLNDGAGVYTEKTQTVALSPMSYSSAALGDIDGDGDLDLVIVGDWGTSSMTPISKIYRNDGTGDFTEINAYSLTSVYYGSIALGDIDRDGDLDLVITGDTTTGSFSTKIYLNDGTGNFTESSSLTGLAHSSITLGDIDNDGDLDLIATGHAYPGSATSTVYKNDGAGSFTLSSSLTGVGNSAIALGDLNNDGYLDLVLTGLTSTSAYTGKICLNNGTVSPGSFTEPGSNSFTGVYMGSVVLGDLDGDGDLDLIATGQNSGSSMASKIYLNDGSGSFAEINSGILVNVRESSMALGDIDGDGDLDLIFTGYGSGNRYGKIYQAIPHP